MTKTIMGVQLKQRNETATEVQSVLTEYGCIIKTRLGVHQASEKSCSKRGIIILELMDDAEKEAKELENALTSISDVVVKKMEF